MSHNPAAIWHTVAMSRDVEAISAILHDNCVFESPVAHTHTHPNINSDQIYAIKADAAGASQYLARMHVLYRLEQLVPARRHVRQTHARTHARTQNTHIGTYMMYCL